MTHAHRRHHVRPVPLGEHATPELVAELVAVVATMLDLLRARRDLWPEALPELLGNLMDASIALMREVGPGVES